MGRTAEEFRTAWKDYKAGKMSYFREEYSIPKFNSFIKLFVDKFTLLTFHSRMGFPRVSFDKHSIELSWVVNDHYRIKAEVYRDRYPIGETRWAWSVATTLSGYPSLTENSFKRVRVPKLELYGHVIYLVDGEDWLRLNQTLEELVEACDTYDARLRGVFE